MSTVTRDERWPWLMHKYLEQNRQTPFEWGVHDCCLFAADVVRAYTKPSIDMATRWRGRYTDQEALARLLRNQGLTGVESIIELVAQDYSLTEVPIKCGMRGDVMLFLSLLGPALGIITDSRVASMSKNGIILQSLELFWDNPFTRVWRI